MSVYKKGDKQDDKQKKEEEKKKKKDLGEEIGEVLSPREGPAH